MGRSSPGRVEGKCLAWPSTWMEGNLGAVQRPSATQGLSWAPCLEGTFSGLGPAHRSLIPSPTPCSLAQVRPDGQPQEVEFIPRDPKTQTI